VSGAFFPAVLVTVALALQILIDPSCTYGATGNLELGAGAGIVLYGGALALELRRIRMTPFGRTERVWWVVTAALALIALAINRQVWSEMLSARPCGPIEYEDGVRYRASHAVIGIGYGVMPLTVAAATLFVGFWNGTLRPTFHESDR
jgi:hypothetical protein